MSGMKMQRFTISSCGSKPGRSGDPTPECEKIFKFSARRRLSVPTLVKELQRCRLALLLPAAPAAREDHPHQTCLKTRRTILNLQLSSTAAVDQYLLRNPSPSLERRKRTVCAENPMTDRL